MAMDRSRRLPILMIVKHGGMDVESTLDEEVKTSDHPSVRGPRGLYRQGSSGHLQLDDAPTRQLSEILKRQWKLFWEMDCELVEMNPLVQTVDGKLVAADAKVVIDEDASYRHPEVDFREFDRTALEQEARENGLALVELEGDIGVLANGAGLTMATLNLSSRPMALAAGSSWILEERTMRKWSSKP